MLGVPGLPARRGVKGLFYTDKQFRRIFQHDFGAERAANELAGRTPHCEPVYHFLVGAFYFVSNCFKVLIKGHDNVVKN
jgi:hypothetical protein